MRFLFRLIFCVALAPSLGAESENEKLIPLHIAPATVFQVTTDAFKQVVSKEIACGKFSGPIASVVPQPEPETDIGYKFVSTSKRLDLEVIGIKKNKTIQAGGFIWTDDSLKWSWKSFPESDVANGVKRLRTYLAMAAFVVTLESGEKFLLVPPPLEYPLQVRLDSDGLLIGSTEGCKFPDGLALEAESKSTETFRSNERECGKGNVIVNGIEFDLEFVRGECALAESGYVSRACKAKEKELADSSKLLKTVTGKQRQLLEVETEALKRSIAELRLQINSNAKAKIDTKLVVRAVYPKSLRPFALVSIELKR